MMADEKSPKKDAKSPKKKGEKSSKKKGEKSSEKKGEASAKKAPEQPTERIVPRLFERYWKEVHSELKKQFGIDNDLAVPRLQKIVVNMGVKGAVENKAKVDTAARDLATITGQKPTIRHAKNAISGFKLRAGMPIACAVTLRKDRMWEFADRLLTIALPRIRDFRGVKSKLDGRGNYSLGISEQSIFPEIVFDRIEFQQGMDITFVTSAPNDEQGYALLQKLGMPFDNKNQDK